MQGKQMLWGISDQFPSVTDRGTCTVPWQQILKRKSFKAHSLFTVLRYVRAETLPGLPPVGASSFL